MAKHDSTVLPLTAWALLGRWPLDVMADAGRRSRFALSEVNRRASVSGTHVYHHYPMRFIPQLAQQLILEYSRQGDVVADPFMGSGTVLVEALKAGRPSWGLDVNPVAHVIAEAKTHPYEPDKLEAAVRRFVQALRPPLPKPLLPRRESMIRVNWWFPADNVATLGALRRRIVQVRQPERPFFLCAFSSILKRCSLWSPDSIKPIRSLKRHRVNVLDPVHAIKDQLDLMLGGNEHLWRATRSHPGIRADVLKGDARRLSASSDSVDLIVMSPPYVTAYDYVQVFELSLLWLGLSKPQALRQQIIGTRVAGGRAQLFRPRTGVVWKAPVDAVTQRHTASGVALARYYADMDRCLEEATRVLHPEGHLVLVVGDGALRGVPLPNSTIFSEVLEAAGLHLVYREERPIGDRSLPPWRDEVTGRFVRGQRPGARLVYPTESVLVFRKPRRRVRRV